jgi:hypothetical protein
LGGGDVLEIEKGQFAHNSHMSHLINHDIAGADHAQFISWVHRLPLHYGLANVDDHLPEFLLAKGGVALLPGEDLFLKGVEKRLVGDLSREGGTRLTSMSGRWKSYWAQQPI